MDRPDGPLEQMPIEQAPMKVRREYLLRERRNSRIAALVLLLVAGGLVWAVVRLVG